MNALRHACYPLRAAHSRPWPGRVPALVRALAVLVTLLAVPGAWASDKLDHERARDAVQAGQVLPLPSLLERLRRTHPGQVLELELEHDDGRWVYEVKLLQAGGQLLKLDVDAATGQVLQMKQKDGRKDRQKDGRAGERMPDREAGRKLEPSTGSSQ